MFLHENSDCTIKWTRKHISTRSRKTVQKSYSVIPAKLHTITPESFVKKNPI